MADELTRVFNDVSSSFDTLHNLHATHTEFSNKFAMLPVEQRVENIKVSAFSYLFSLFHISDDWLRTGVLWSWSMVNWTNSLSELPRWILPRVIGVGDVEQSTSGWEGEASDEEVRSLQFNYLLNGAWLELVKFIWRLYCIVFCCRNCDLEQRLYFLETHVERVQKDALDKVGWPFLS